LKKQLKLQTMTDDKRFIKYAFLWIPCVILMDQLSKWYMIEKVLENTPFIKVNDYFNLVMTFNKGVSFSMFSDYGANGRLILILVGTIITIALLIWLWRATNWMLGFGLASIIGGAIGNLIDRFTHPGVIDFIQVHWENHYWPAFNVADSFITIGVGFIIVESFVNHKGEKSVS